MPPEQQSKQLVYELDAWYRSHKMRQKDLAGALNMSPQQLAEILGMRNRPTGEQALAINSFLLESQSMSVFEPTKPDRPPRVDDPDKPRTLAAAQERIDALNVELRQLRGAPASTATRISKPAPATRPTASMDGTPTFDASNPATWDGKLRVTAFPVGCDNPRAIGEYLSTLSTEALRGHLTGTPASATEQLQQRLVLAELQNRRSSPRKL